MLSSSRLVYTPGMIDYWRVGYRTQPRLMVQMLNATYSGLPRGLAKALLSRDKTLSVEEVGEDVRIGWPRGCPSSPQKRIP